MIDSSAFFLGLALEGQYETSQLDVEQKPKTFLDKSWMFIKDGATEIFLDVAPGVGLIALGVLTLPFLSALSIPLIGLGCGLSVTMISLKVIHQFTYLRTQDLNFLADHPFINVALIIGTIYLAIMFPVVGFCVAVVMGSICGLSLQANLMNHQRSID